MELELTVTTNSCSMAEAEQLQVNADCRCALIRVICGSPIQVLVLEQWRRVL